MIQPVDMDFLKRSFLLSFYIWCGMFHSGKTILHAIKKRSLFNGSLTCLPPLVPFSPSIHPFLIPVLLSLFMLSLSICLSPYLSLFMSHSLSLLCRMSFSDHLSHFVYLHSSLHIYLSLSVSLWISLSSSLVMNLSLSLSFSFSLSSHFSQLRLQVK